MIKVGLTGNIGSGKSTVSKIFEALRVPVYHADTEAKKFLDTPEVISQLRALFGESITVDNRINRKTLAAIVFNDEKKLQQLNEIIHPFVEEDYKYWCSKQRDVVYTLQEAAILVESGFYRFMDKIVVVTAPVETRINRIIERDQATRDEVLSRMERQLPETELKGYADFIVSNSGEKLVIPQVLEIHNKLQGPGDTY